ncbi:MAG TPA: S-methyl-5-thioribose kinase [Geminicoccaceae bacterium]
MTREGTFVLLHGRPPAGYRELSPSRLASYLLELPELAAALGGRPQLWRIEQVRDNDMNLVFMVDGPGGQLCVKQALPSVRLGGRTVAVPLERTIFEEAALTFYRRIAPERMPRVLHYDSEQFILVMEQLVGYDSLRRALVAGRRFDHLAGQVGAFLADSLFATSDLGMPALEKRERLAFFCGNGELRHITEELVFTDPFGATAAGAWLSPELDPEVRELRNDQDMKRAVAALKLKFLAQPQALLHGDLHTGSLMVSRSDVKVIDAEFAGFGPIGFDIGMLLGNLLIAYFTQAGRASAEDPREATEAWILEVVQRIWSVFAERFVDLWRGAAGGDGVPAVLFEGPGGADSRRVMEQSYMRGLFEDAVRFAGLAMVRRVIGVRPVIDLTTIPDRARRATAERRILLLARELIKDAQHVEDLAQVAMVAREIRAGNITHA